MLILVTHNVAEAENVVDKVAILHNGKVLKSGTGREIRGEKGDTLRFEFLPSGGFQEKIFLKWAQDIFQFNERTAITVPKERVAETIDWVRAQIDIGNICDYTLSESTLEDVYVKLTTEKREVV